MFAQFKMFLRTVSVGCPPAGPRTLPRARTYSGQRRRADWHTTSFTQVNSYVKGQAGAYCKTVGFAYPGSNPGPATSFRSSEPVTLDCVTGFSRERERFSRPSALSCGHAWARTGCRPIVLPVAGFCFVTCRNI